jgi:ADP-ribosylglycohydrolase
MNATPKPDPNHEERLKRARLCLDGLSVGDSFGQRFFFQSTIDFLLKEKALPAPPWRYTDDTVMALSVYEVLAEYGIIEQDQLALRFAERFKQEPNRGYAHGAVDLLEGINRGEDWRAAAAELFDGEGSMGNGSAMRVGPVGAYFADDLDALVTNAAASAEITHAHPDAKAGAIAVALAVAYAWRTRAEGIASAEGMIDFVLQRTPIGRTYDEIAIAATIPLSTAPRTAAGRLGNGSYVLCADTVPFCIWSAARALHNFEGALWNTVSVHGDMDTTCAIVGGIVAMSDVENGIPAEWLVAREPLDL